MLKFKGMLFTLVVVLAFAKTGLSQVYEPVTWTFSSKVIKDDLIEVSLKANIEAGWHVYAMELPSDEGPIPTSFEFKKSDLYSLQGKIEQEKFKTAYDPNFGMDLYYFDNSATFKQVIKRKTSQTFSVKGMLTFMVCNDEMCLPPEDVEFKIKVPEAQNSTPKNQPLSGAQFSLPIAGQSDSNDVLLPVTWKISIEKETSTSAVILAEAEIEEGWYVYSSKIDGDMGPMPTSFSFDDSTGFTLDGPIEEFGTERQFDPIFEMELGYFKHKATLRQKVLKRSTEPLTLQGYLTFMTCDGFKCLAPEDVEFALELAPASSGYEAELKDGGPKESSRSNWGIFIIAFLSGFAALLTPCVFPMIPLTVSFFTKQSKSRSAGIRNAVIYGLSIIGIYVLLGVVVTAIFGASVLSELSTDPWFNLFFFLLLVIFAVSFLGAFEITLPSSWVNKADAQADRGGYIGIFFMAFTLALVSFSCTGPIVGTLIVEAASKGGSAPVIGMLGFSLAIALPFALFAAFPGWLNSLPQSGGWLNSIKVTLGFLELALALKFLSNADMVLQWGLLEREVFLSIWIVIFGLLTLYLLGKLKLSHDSDLPYLSVTRLSFAMLTGMFTVYLIPGLWGAPLKLISAFPPPMHYSESPHGVGQSGAGGGLIDKPENSDVYLGPQGLYVYKDYDKGLAAAKEANKPVMLDFTGHACVNCRKMEQQVWSDPEIKRKLAQEVILVSLYVDEKTALPEAEQIEVELTGGRKKKLRNVGNKWAAFQEIRYGINAQPYYVLLDHKEKMLNEPANYQDYGDIEEFDDWLTRGLKAFMKP
jgi:thiol:disulfide interchange protein DsbD